MKILFLSTFILTLALSNVQSQVSYYLMGGISPAISPSNADILLNRSIPADLMFFNIDKMRMQLYAGVIGRIELPRSKFFTESGIVYSYRNYIYSCEYIVPDYHSFQSELMAEREHLIIFPVNIGFHFASMNITSGLSLIACAGKNSDLAEMHGYSSTGSAFRPGWQTSLAYVIKSVTLGVSYFGNLFRFGYGTTLHGQSLELRHVPGQFVFNVQTKL